MRYLTTEELKADPAYAHQFLAGKTRREAHEGLSIALVKKYVDRFWRNRRTVSILDFGTSGGTFLNELHHTGFSNIYAADLEDYRSDEAKAVTQEFGAADFSFDQLPWPDNFFNVITAWCVLPHLENPFHAAREIYRALSPGGLFIFSTLHLGGRASRDYFSRHGDFRSFREANNHIAVLPPGVLTKTLFSYFELLATEYHVHEAVFEGRGGSVRALAWKLARSFPYFRRILEKRWAYHIIYVGQKRATS